MNYTDAKLMLFGMLGIILHNLVQLNKINRSSKGKVNGSRVKIIEYIKAEIYSIIICILSVYVAILAKHEIKQLEAVSSWLGLAFVSIGYMGQSLLITFMGKVEDKIK